MVIHQNFTDFVLFLYVHVAYADGFFHPNERESIKGKLNKLYPASEDYAALINKVEAEYIKLDKKVVGEIITDTFKQYTNITFLQKYKVYADMFDIIRADGKVEESETIALDELKRIIDLSSEHPSAKHK